MKWSDWISVISGIWGLGLGALVTSLIGRARERKHRARRLRTLQDVGVDGAIALCIRVGGNSDPIEDVKAFLRDHQPQIRKLAVYQAAGDLKLDQPSVAHRVVDDIREGIRGLGETKITHIHFFPVGMTAFPVAVGALLSNWGCLIVYQRSGPTYVPVYQVDHQWMHEKRMFTAIGKWDQIDLESEPALEHVSLNKLPVPSPEAHPAANLPSPSTN